MDNIYGGLPGQSFVLKDRFPSVEEMVNAFKMGSEYKKTWYGEYCIIDTPNKNHKDNGKIFRRGYNNLDNGNNVYGGGAIYVGRIVGPSGGTPYVELMTLKELEESSVKAEQESRVNEYTYFRSKSNKNGKYSTGKELIQNGLNEGTNDSSLIVPGKDAEGNYHDSIRWGWYNVRKDQNSNLDDTHGLADNNNDSESWVRLGFEFPYTTNSFAAIPVDQYDDEGNYISNATKVIETMPDDGKPHPYHHDYSILVPKGVKGESVSDLQVVKASFVNDHQVYEWNLNTNFEYVYVNEDEARLKDIKGNVEEIQQARLKKLKKSSAAKPLKLGEGVLADVSPDNEIVVYKFTQFDNKKDGDEYWIFVSVYKNLKGIKVVSQADYEAHKDLPWEDNTYVEYNYFNTTTQNNDTVLVYTTGAKKPLVFPHLLRRVKANGVQLDSNVVEGQEVGTSGRLLIPFTDGTQYEKHLRWVDDIDITPNGDWVKKSVGEKAVSIPKRFNWLKDLTINPQTGVATASYNNDNNIYEASSRTTQLDWIDGVKVSDDGSITYHHTHGEKNDGVNNVQEKALTWISKIDVDDKTGKFDITTNNGKLDIHKQLSWLNDINIAEDGTVNYGFTDSNDNKQQAKQLSWITSVDLNTDTGLLSIKSNNDKPGVALDKHLSWIKDIEAVEQKDLASQKKTGIRHNRKGLKFIPTHGEAKTFNDLLPHIDTVYFSKETGKFEFLNTNDESIVSQDTVDTIKEMVWDKDLNQMKIKSYLGSLDATSETMQWIDKIEYSPENYHVYVLPNLRPSNKVNYPKDDTRLNWNLFVDNPNSWVKRTGKGTSSQEWWIDLGAVKDDSGILIGENYDEKALKDDLKINPSEYTTQKVIDALNDKYPEGMPERKGVTRGKIITTVRSLSSGTKKSSEFFAYDYKNLAEDGSTKGTWYSLGGIETQGEASFALTTIGSDFDSEMLAGGSKDTFNKLMNKGIVLLTTAVNDKAKDNEAKDIFTELFDI